MSTWIRHQALPNHLRWHVFFYFSESWPQSAASNSSTCWAVSAQDSAVRPRNSAIRPSKPKMAFGSVQHDLINLTKANKCVGTHIDTSKGTSNTAILNGIQSAQPHGPTCHRQPTFSHPTVCRPRSNRGASTNPKVSIRSKSLAAPRITPA